MARLLALVLLVACAATTFWLYSRHVDSLTRSAGTRAPLPVAAPPLVMLEELDELPPLRTAPDIPRPEGAASETRENVAAADRCLAIGPFADMKASARLREWLRDYIAFINTRIETVREQRFLWVYLEPTTDEDARARIDALRAQGVDDYLLIRRGDLRNAISLGLFRSQDSVNRRLAEMSERGYKPVVVPRFETSHRIWVDARLARDHADDFDVPESLLGAAAVNELSCASL